MVLNLLVTTIKGSKLFKKFLFKEMFENQPGALIKFFLLKFSPSLPRFRSLGIKPEMGPNDSPKMGKSVF